METEQAPAFLQLYDLHVKRIYRYLYSRTRHRETAEDLTSQTFLKAFERFATFDAAKASGVTWLYRIARNTLIDHLRVTHPSEPIEDAADGLRSRQNVERDVSARLEIERVREALEQLTPSQREVVLLRVWDELSFAEIAEVTGKGTAAGKMMFQRALASLRKQFGPLALLLVLLSR